jgi:hypothetical protein
MKIYICTMEGKMKNRLFLDAVTVALIAAFFSACVGGASTVSAQTTSPQDQLDAAIRDASNYLNGKVPKGSKVVFLNIKSDYPDLSEYLLSVLSENAVNDGVFAVVDRQQLDSIRAELNFQMSGEVSDESAQSIGQMLGAQSIVSGAVSKIGPLYRVQVKAIEVQTAGVQAQWSRNISGNATITALTANYAPAGTGTAAASAPATGSAPSSSGSPAAAQSPAASPPPTYKIGDTGPAGGIVFYDMGFYMDGWRYLEAAPQDFPVSVKWTNAGIGTFTTETGIGTGKQNTSYLVSFLRGNGETMRAAQVVSVPEYGGYGDWFLPSRDELNLLYENLRKQRIGEFSNNVYWSSSGGITTGLNWNLVAWQINFSDGTQNRVSCSADGLVRAVRRF